MMNDAGHGDGLALTREDAITLLNEAKLSDKEDKQNLLAQVFEYAFNSHRQSLPELYAHLLEFELDPSVAIRKYVIGCIETVCKTLPEYTQQSLDNLCRLIVDDNANVVKRAILCGTNIWRSSLEYVCSGPKPSPEQIQIWNGLTTLKNIILKALDDQADSIKPHALKFIETLVFTFSSPASGDKKNKMDTFTLDSIPPNHPLLSSQALKREGESYLQLLIDTLRKPGLSNTTISSIINTLTAIARLRSAFIVTIVQALVQLHQQPSPSFSSFIPSQQQNVNHSLRLALLAILRLRQPTLAPQVVALVETLTALGSKEHMSEAVNFYGNLSDLPQPPSRSQSNKRALPPDSPPRPSKVAKPEPEPAPRANQPQSPPQPTLPVPPTTNTLGQTEQASIIGLLALLPTDLVVKLVFENMLVVPLPPGLTVGPNTVADFLRFFQAQIGQQITPAPAPTPAQAPPARVDPRMGGGVDPRADQRPSNPPPADPRVPPRDPRMRHGPDTKGNIPIAPQSPPLQLPVQQTSAPSNSPIPPILDSAPIKVPIKLPPEISVPTAGFPTAPISPSGTPPSSLLPIPPISQPPIPVQQTPPQPLPLVKPQLPKAPVLPLPTFTETQLRNLYDLTFLRLMGAETGATLGGKRIALINLVSALWVSLMARLAGSLPLDGEVVQKLITYAFSDFNACRELLHTWIYHEFLASPTVRYPQLIEALLTALRTLEPTNRAFNALIVEIPVIPEEVWTMMCEYSTSRDRVTLGLSTLRDLVVWRPPVRERGLNLLLEYTHHEDENIRSPAIRLVANQLYPLPALTQAIVEHASAQLSSVATTDGEKDADNDVTMQDGDSVKIKSEPTSEESKSDENGAEGKKEGEEDAEKEAKEVFAEAEIQRKLFLYFALCTKKHELLTGLLDVYMHTTPRARKVIHQQMNVLIKTIGMGSVHLLQLISQCPKGSEGFILQVLRILTEATKPAPGLVNAVKSAYKRLGDARLLIPILGGMEKDEVISLLPRLLVLPPAAAKAVVTRLAVGNAPLTCTELLVAVHLMENVPIKRMLEAAQYCLEMNTVFKHDVMAVVLSQLSSQPQVPQLFMFTALQTLQRFHKLTGYIMELMLGLIPKQVWTDKRLWEGFIRCCRIAKPASFKVLLKLPVGPLEEFLKVAPELKEPLAKAAKTDKKSIPKTVLKVLGFDEPATEEREV